MLPCYLLMLHALSAFTLEPRFIVHSYTHQSIMSASSLRRLGLGIPGGGLATQRNDASSSTRPNPKGRAHPYAQASQPGSSGTGSSGPVGQREIRGAKFERALQIAGNPSDLSTAMEELERDKYAASGASSRDTWWRT